MAETSDYDPGPWRGHDFGTARKAYTDHAGRSYSDASAKGVDASTLVPATLTTNSPAPLVILCDVTGSMGTWPGVIFSKLPYLDIEGKTYLGPEMEISFGAVGDAPSGDTYPLQVCPFDKGTPLADHLKKLIVEGKGGGDSCESYELAALYYARNVTTPRATKPILIFIGDEGLHSHVEKEHAAQYHITLEKRISVGDIFKELTRKFSVYVIRKRYDSGEATVQTQWVGLLGENRVVPLQAPERVVDVIFGILAAEMGMVDEFRKEIEGRQTADQVATVYKSLRTVHAHLPVNGTPDDAAKKIKVAKAAASGKSVMHIPDGKKTKGLLGK